MREEQEVLINFALNIRNSFLPGKGNKLKGIDALDDSKKTAFFYAAERGNNKVCKLLLDAGSNWSLVAQTHPSLAIVHGDNTKLEEFNPQRCSFKSLFSQGFLFARDVQTYLYQNQILTPRRPYPYPHPFLTLRCMRFMSPLISKGKR